MDNYKLSVTSYFENTIKIFSYNYFYCNKNVFLNVKINIENVTILIFYISTLIFYISFYFEKKISLKQINKFNLQSYNFKLSY